jgi:L-serine dehydratase
MSIINEVFKIGIGPSSSHTVGPMRAARCYLRSCFNEVDVSSITRVTVELYGSLALTGLGHATDKAVLLGLLGEGPATVEINKIEQYLSDIKKNKEITLLGKHKIAFNINNDLIYYFREALPEHANGMVLSVYDSQGEKLHSDTYFSVGGGIIRTKQEYLEEQEKQVSSEPVNSNQSENKIIFSDAKTLLALCSEYDCSISQLMWEMAIQLKQVDEAKTYLSDVWDTMQICVENGIQSSESILPGGLNVQRRAPALYAQLKEKLVNMPNDPASIFDWVSLFAIAVNEENAAGHRVVTAPTNGSAGVIPAVMHYLKKFHRQEFTQQKALDFLMTATAIGSLYQKGASISAAEMGCQGEIGVSCSMASAALCEFMGGSPQQVANAAEIGMEHHLGMTCDPINGLVQIPCIERNTMGAIKAINSARLSLTRDEQKITLDQVIKTMFETGKDMSEKYKETALGGLAIHSQCGSYEESTQKTEAYDITQNQVAC